MPADDKGLVAILCGGRGTRLQERTQSIPKPLVEIGSKPILWHVIRIYAAHGFNDFLLLTGHKSELIDSFVAAEPWPEGVEVSTLFTGEDTPTGGRLHLAADRLADRTFCATYADGVADVDLGCELELHREHALAATITVVRPELQFDVTELNGDGQIAGFKEKPRSEHWINGGFFVFEPEVLGYLDESSVLEREPLEGLAAAGQLHAFRHDGFWECMDTYKDAVQLNDLWAEPKPPWKIWN